MTVLGPGNDFFTTGSGDDLIDGAEGNDTLDAGAGDDTVFGGLGNDSLRVGTDPGNDEYYGGDGDDTLQMGAGNALDLAYGGSGDDTIQLDYRLATGPVSLVFGPNCTVLLGGVAGIAISGVENLTINGTNGNDFVQGGKGNDSISLDLGIDTALGGAGDDTIWVQDRFTAEGGNGTDKLGLNMASVNTGVVFTMSSSVTLAMPGFNGTATGFERVEIATGSGNDSLTGANKDDLLQGNAGNDTLTGLGGNDRLILGSGADVAYGGAGDDNINPSGTTGSGALIYGGSGNDTVSGYQLSDTIYGGADDDEIQGLGGSDLLYGDAGNDTFRSITAGAAYGGAGNDTMTASFDFQVDSLYGGGDLDTLVGKALVLGAPIVMTKTAAGMEIVLNGTLSTLAKGFEQFSIQGSTLADSLLGGTGNDTLTGEVTINGGAADNDTLTGLGGDDLLTGGDGNDLLDGGAGRDTLIGGTGQDTMTGGGGPDTFRFATTGESGPTTSDQITDFTQGPDAIDLSAIDATPGNAATDSFRFLGQTAFDGGQGALIFAFSGGNTIVSADLNGDKVADMVIELTGTITLVAGDFVL